MTLHTVVVAAAIAIAIWLAAIVALYAFGKPKAAKELVTLVPNLLRLFRGLMKDPRVPRRAKVLLAIGAVWLASPIDLLPEFLPVIGPLDDAVVAALVLRYLANHTGRAVIEDHWQGNPQTLERVLRLFGHPEKDRDAIRDEAARGPAHRPDAERVGGPAGRPAGTARRVARAAHMDRPLALGHSYSTSIVPTNEMSTWTSPSTDHSARTFVVAGSGTSSIPGSVMNTRAESPACLVPRKLLS